MRLALLAALLALPLAAQGPLAYNLHLGMASAQGDFRSEVGSTPGLEAGLSLTVPLTARLALRPRVSYELFPVQSNTYSYRSTRYFDRGYENAKWNAWSFGADCLFRPGGPEAGLYLFSGLHLKVWRVESYGTYTTRDQLSGTRVYTVDDTSTSNEPAFDAGLGFTFSRHFSAESRMTLSSYRKLSYNTLQIGVVASF